MSHLVDGTIVAIRDGSLVDADATEHLGTCSSCQAALDDARARANAIERILSQSDDVVDLNAAKAAVRARLDARTTRQSQSRRLRGYAGRAAAVLLVAAGAAYALPGSPLRDLIAPATPGPTVATGTEGGSQDVPSQGGIVVEVPDGRIRIVLSGLSDGEALDIVWMDAASARIVAAAGSSFSFAEGRAEASVAPGPVRVELPRQASAVAVEVDGRTYLRRTSGSLEILEPVSEVSEDRIRFLIGGR